VSVFITEKSAPYYWYSFQIQRRRFFGSTRCKARKEAERFEALERERAKELIKATQRAATSLAMKDVTARLWTDSAQYDAEPDATFTNIGRLVDYFGGTTLLTDIDHAKAKKLVAWRRGHRVSGRKDQTDAPLIANATVNRSTTKMLQRLFTFAKAEGARFEREPKWDDLLLPEPVERIRELQDAEADAINEHMRADYEPFFAFARGTGMRLRELVGLKWSEVNFGTKQIIKTGKGGRRIVCEITPTIRDIIFPLQGHHPDFVFTYVCACSNRRTGRIKGERYPLTIDGVKQYWKQLRANAGVTDFRFHDFRHDFGSKLLRVTGNLKLVQRAMNHADIKTTLRYAHVLQSDIAEAIERVAQAQRQRSAGKRTGKLKEVG
jgi:integrase